MRTRTWLSRASFIGAALLLALALFAPSLSAQTDDRPASFQSRGYASAIQVALNTDPQTFVLDLVRVEVPHGVAEFASGDDVSSRAASFYPGLGVQEGPALGWGQACSRGFPCEQFFPDGGFPPPWPFTAGAEYPTIEEASAPVPGQKVGAPGDPVSFNVHEVKATATQNGATSTAIIADLDLIPVAGAAQSIPGVGNAANPSLVHVGELAATTNLRFEGKVLVARAESRMTDVSLFGGAVEIERLVARSTSRNDGDSILDNDPVVTVEGVTVAGQAAKITSNGIILADTAVDQGALNTLGEGVEKLFGATGADVRLIDSEDDRREGTASGDAVGLLVSFKIDASGFPGGVGVLGDLVLGTAATSAFADTSGLDDTDVFFEDDFDFDGDFGFNEFGGGDDGSDFASVAGEAIEAGDDLQAAPTLVGPSRRLERRFAPLELLSGVAADRIKLLYGAWTLTLVGLALGSRTRLFGLLPKH